MNRAERRKHSVTKGTVRHLLDLHDLGSLEGIAQDIADGTIFTHFHVPMEKLATVFPKISLFGKRNAKWFSERVGLIYMYKSEAVQWDISHTIPIFNHVRALSKDQGAWVINRYNEIRRIRGEQTNTDPKESGSTTIPEFPITPIVADTTTE